jgi:hypothetical protein
MQNIHLYTATDGNNPQTNVYNGCLFTINPTSANAFIVQ